MLCLHLDPLNESIGYLETTLGLVPSTTFTLFNLVRYDLNQIWCCCRGPKFSFKVIFNVVVLCYVLCVCCFVICGLNVVDVHCYVRDILLFSASILVFQFQ